MRKIIFYILLLEVLNISISYSQISDHELYLYAEGAIYDGNISAAINYLKLVEDKNDKHLFTLARAYYAKNNADSALKIIDSIRIDTNNEALYLKIKCYTQLNNIDSCISTLSQYLTKTPKKSEAEILLDDVFIDFSGNMKWENLWKQNWYTQSEKTNAELKYLLQGGEYISIIDTISNISHNKLDAEKFYYNAYANLNLGKNKEALSQINTALKYDRTNIKFKQLKHKILSKLSRHEESIEELDDIIKTHPEEFETYLQLAISSTLINSYTEAIDYLTTYNKYITSNKSAILMLCEAYVNDGQYLNALSELNKFINSNPSYFKAYKLRAISYYKTNMLKYAKNDFMYALDINPNDNEIYFYVALILLKSGNNHTACNYLKKASELGNREAYIKYLETCE